MFFQELKNREGKRNSSFALLPNVEIEVDLPVKQEKATSTVLEQAELLSAEWVIQYFLIMS